MTRWPLAFAFPLAILGFAAHQHASDEARARVDELLQHRRAAIEAADDPARYPILEGHLVRLDQCMRAAPISDGRLMPPTGRRLESRLLATELECNHAILAPLSASDPDADAVRRVLEGRGFVFSQA